MRGLSSNLIVKASMALYSIISVPILIGSLGTGHYGYLLIMLQLISLSQLLEIGLVSALGRSLAKSRGSGDLYKFNLITSTTFWALILFGSISCLIITVAFTFTQEYFFDRLFDENDVKFYYVCLGLTLLNIPLRVGRGLLEARYAFVTIDLINILTRSMSLLVLLYLYYVGHLTLQAAVIISLISHLLPEMIFFLIGTKFQFSKLLSLKLIKKNIFQKQFDIGISIFISTLTAQISRQGFILLYISAVGHEFGYLMSIPIMFILTVSPLIGKISAIYVTRLSELLGLGDRQKAEIELFKALQLSAFLSVIILGTWSILGEDLINYWLGKTLINDDIELINFLIFWMLSVELLLQSFKIFRTFAQADNAYRYVTIVSSLSAIWTIGGAIYLTTLATASTQTLSVMFLFLFIIRVLLFDTLLMTFIAIYKCKINFRKDVFFRLFLIVILGILGFGGLIFLIRLLPDVFYIKVLLSVIAVSVISIVYRKYFMQTNL